MKVVLHLTNPNVNIYNIQVNRKMKIFNLKNSWIFPHAVLTIENQDYTKLNKIN